MIIRVDKEKNILSSDLQVKDTSIMKDSVPDHNLLYILYTCSQNNDLVK